LETIIEKITGLLEAKFEAPEFKDCFVVEIKISKSTKVQVFIDCDSGVDLTKCRIVSRHLEAYLDEELPLGEKYTLEVSSPGIDRPLIVRQYPKNIGRRLKLSLKNGDVLKGKLLSVDDSCMILEVQESKKLLKEVEIKLEELEKVKVIVSF